MTSNAVAAIARSFAIDNEKAGVMHMGYLAMASFYKGCSLSLSVMDILGIYYNEREKKDTMGGSSNSCGEKSRFVLFSQNKKKIKK